MTLFAKPGQPRDLVFTLNGNRLCRIPWLRGPKTTPEKRQRVTLNNTVGLPEMLSRLKYHWRLSRLFSELEKTRRVYSKHLKAAMVPGMKKEDYLSLKAEAQHEEYLVQEDIDIHVSSFLLRKA